MQTCIEVIIIVCQIYKRLSKGGYLYLDEYYSLKFPGPRLYCNNFAKNHNIKNYKEKNRWRFSSIFYSKRLS